MLSKKTILDLQFPDDLRQLPCEDLPEVAQAFRKLCIETVAETGGHLGASLGVVELTLALHYVFDTPRDRLIFDVSHQAYIHKMITGRASKMRRLRQDGGISGFTRREESPYDPFGAAHSSTSISAGLGFAKARDHLQRNHRVIAVIGDGALSAGLSFEGINNLGGLKTPMLVVLNDNGMSIAPAVGAMSQYLQLLPQLSKTSEFNHLAQRVTNRFVEHLPPPMRNVANFAKQYSPQQKMTNLFENLGLTYKGVIDGHDILGLVDQLRECKEQLSHGPIFLHCLTQKGHGYPPAEKATERYHGVNPFNVETGKSPAKAKGAPTYTQVFTNGLITLANQDPRIVAITSAMPSGTGLDRFAEQFPDRTYDVGIAEQHAVTFAGGLAAEGMKPFVAIYSTFLQRAYDQVIHDIALQNLPVRFIIDRAGFVGADGASHAGAFDLVMLTCLPEIVVMAPSDEAECLSMLKTLHEIEDRPSVMRFPRGAATGMKIPEQTPSLPIGKARWLREGKHAVIFALGTIVEQALEAATILHGQGIDLGIVDARFAKPIDSTMLQGLAKDFPLLVTLEEGALGGFSSQVLDVLVSTGTQRDCDLLTLAMPDRFINHATQHQQRVYAGLDGQAIAARIAARLKAKSQGEDLHSHNLSSN